MSSDLNSRNGKAAMMYVKDVPWHGMGTKLEGLATSAEAIEAAQLDYEVVKKPIFAVINEKQKIFKSVPRRFATVRMDTLDVLGDVGSRYHVIQNKDAFRFFDSLVGEGAAIYETAGALGLGERIWILAKLPGHIKVKGKDIVDKYLLLSNSHDGSSIVRAKLTPVRVVCANTLSLALRGSDEEVRVRHTANAEEALEEAHKLLGLTNQLYEQVTDIFRNMSLVNFTGDQIVDYVKTLVPDNDGAENHTRTENIRGKILDLHESGAGSEMTRGTLWGVYNAVSEFTDHVYTTTEVDKKLNSIWFGSGALLKTKAFNLAKDVLEKGVEVLTEKKEK
jgi:phage/plasmid-like protein (TIGR03299 family)